MERSNWKKQYGAAKVVSLLRKEYGAHFDYSIATDDAGIHIVITCHQENAASLRDRAPVKFEGYRVLVLHNNETRRDNLRKEKEELENAIKELEMTA